MRDIAAGIDTSTQSTTVVLRSLIDGALIAHARVPHSVATPPCSEQDPEEWWLALKEAFGKLQPFLSRIACIGVGGQGHGLVILDENGESLRPAKLWNDTESAFQAVELLKIFPYEEWERRTGSLPAPALTISKLLWTKQNYPELLNNIKNIMLPFDYIVYMLTGNAVCERGGTSGTGYFNPYINMWDTEILQGIFPEIPLSVFPEIVASNAIAGTVKKIDGLEELEGASVCVGTGDNMAAAIGVCAQEYDTVMSLGTSGTVYTLTSEPVQSTNNGSINYYADATDRFLPMVTTLNASKVTDTFRRIMGVTTSEFDELALSDKTFGMGVVLVPYLDGERTPNLPFATGRLSGLKTVTTQANIAAAATAGVICGLLEGRWSLESIGLKLSGRFILTGGGSQSVAYRQFLADFTGENIYISTVHESAASGAAVMAAASFQNTDIKKLMLDWAAPYQLAAEPRKIKTKHIMDAYKAEAEKILGEEAGR